MVAYLRGDQSLFDEIKSCFITGLVKSVDSPGHNERVYLLTNTVNQFFIKPTDKWKQEILAYELAKTMQIDQYFMPTVAFRANGTVFIANPMYKSDFMALQDFEVEHPGAMDGILQKMIDSGDAHKLAVFDFLIGNQDRHRGNVQTDGSTIIVIDHDRAFSSYGHWVPAYLRKSDWKPKAALPLCVNYTSLEQWFNKLSFKNQILQQRLDLIKSVEKTRLDEKINHLWETL